MKSPRKTSVKLLSCISLMSAPAAKAFSDPVSTIAPIAGIALEGVQRGVELLDQRARKRVQRLRPVEPDEADAAMGLDDDVGVGHGRVSSRCLRTTPS